MARRVTWNYIIDVIFGLLMLCQGVVGFILWFAVPSGYRYRGGLGGDDVRTFLLTRQEWLDIHRWVAVALVVVFAIHIFIHWQWLVSMTKSYFRQR